MARPGVGVALFCFSLLWLDRRGGRRRAVDVPHAVVEAMESLAQVGGWWWTQSRIRWAFKRADAWMADASDKGPNWYMAADSAEAQERWDGVSTAQRQGATRIRSRRDAGNRMSMCFVSYEQTRHRLREASRASHFSPSPSCRRLQHAWAAPHGQMRWTWTRACYRVVIGRWAGDSPTCTYAHSSRNRAMQTGHVLRSLPSLVVNTRPRRCSCAQRRWVAWP